MKYSAAKEFNPTMTECFFAFSKSQLEEGTSKLPEGVKLLSAGHGLFGTDAGIKQFMQELADVRQRIINNCDPQDVYNYEFSNHECGYTGSDEDALNIVNDYFPGAVVKRFPAELMEEI